MLSFLIVVDLIHIYWCCLQKIITSWYFWTSAYFQKKSQLVNSEI